MLFYNVKTGEYPRHQGDLELLGWQVGQELPEGWVQVEYATEIPSRNEDEVIYEALPELKNGIYFQALKVRPMTAEEIERRDAPKTAKAKLIALGLTEAEVEALIKGFVR